MLFDRNNLTELLELGAGEVSDFCNDYLDSDKLAEHIERMEPFSRKELCQYLGIGESTMTGWLKEDRIPLMAKEAFLLPLVHRVLRDEIVRLRKEKDNARILKSGDSYQIVVFRPDEAGESIGIIVADNITNLHNARLILSGMQALDLLYECDDTPLEYAINRIQDLEDPDFQNYLESLEQLRMDVRMCLSYAGDYEKWRDLQKLIMESEHSKTKEGRAQAKKAAEDAMKAIGGRLKIKIGARNTSEDIKNTEQKAEKKP
jgi:hypothetical protein